MRWPRPPRIPRYQPRREVGWMMALGHYMVWPYLVAVAATVTWDCLGEPGGWVNQVTELPGCLAIAALVCNITQHMTFMCERCAAATPLDPERKVRRWKPLLRLMHFQGLFWVWIAALVSGQVAESLMGRHPLTYAVDIAVNVGVLVLVTGSWIHNGLQPWCPWCNWGRGGEHEEAPDPDPAMAL